MKSHVIYKYVLPSPAERQSVEMPLGARVLTVREQNGKVTLWALVAPKAPLTRHWFRILATGDSLDLTESLVYLGTAFLADGTVWHVHDAGVDLA